MGLKPTCREVHRLVSESMDRRLSPLERLRMALHMMVCRACNNFHDQMKMLREAMRRLTHGDLPPGED